jgi:hypothetical protein
MGDAAPKLMPAPKAMNDSLIAELLFEAGVICIGVATIHRLESEDSGRAHP